MLVKASVVNQVMVEVDLEYAVVVVAGCAQERGVGLDSEERPCVRRFQRC